MFRVPALLLALLFIPAAISGSDSPDLPEASYPVLMKPLVLALPAADGNLQVSLESLAPDGKTHPVIDVSGNTRWLLNGDENAFRIIPSAGTYAGPLVMTVNGRVISPPAPADGRTGDWVVQKFVYDRTADGTVLRVHFTDFLLQKSGDRYYPQKVLIMMKRAYDILTQELGFAPTGHLKQRAIDAYLGDGDEAINPFDEFSKEDFKRAPLFLMRESPRTHRKSPAILLPADYGRFFTLWNRINRVPAFGLGTADQGLAGSILHEMTHALLHPYHGNLGSTEHRIHNGDWYTEGLARYFETKIGSDAGFLSQGFRKVMNGKLCFSRGGANYYLKHPDESFFGLRYENALFWLYFEMTFGMGKVIELTRYLKDVAYDAQPWEYAYVLEKVTGLRLSALLDEYFNWVYRAEYRSTREGRWLTMPAKTRTVWSAGKFRWLDSKGRELLRSQVLSSDWVARWGKDEAESLDQTMAGDTTPEADIKPLAFDIQEVLIGKGSMPAHVVLTNTGASARLRVTFYLSGNRKISYLLSAGDRITLPADYLGDTRKIGIVLSNLDFSRNASYKIEAD